MKTLIHIGIFLLIVFAVASFLHRQAVAYMLDTDLPGMDYKNFDLNASDPKLCENTCLKEQKCLAWTYVKPGIQGPQPRCWLKYDEPPMRSNTCCISGTVLRLPLAAPEPLPLATPQSPREITQPPKTITSQVKKPIAKSSIQVVSLVPTIISPTQGQEFRSDTSIKIKVSIPSGITNSYVKLKFHHKQGNTWINENVIPGYDVKSNPNGMNVNYTQFGKKGHWRIQAQLSAPANAPWTDPLTFRIK